MIDDLDTKFSDGWWLKTLATQLATRRFSRKWNADRQNAAGVRPPLELLDDYYRNEPPLPRLSRSWGDGTRDFLRLARMNYAALVTESVANRIMPQGWRTAADSDRDGDSKAREIADANQFDVKIGDVVLMMLNFGDAYTIVGGPDPESTNPDVPIISAEDPREVITAEDPATGRTIAALKMYRDPWLDRDLAYLYLPGKVRCAWTEERKWTSLVQTGAFSPKAWSWNDERSGNLPEQLGKRVPVAHFRNRDGVGEFERHLAVLDRINDGIFDRITIAKHQAHRQRGLVGLPDVYPDDHQLAGQQIEYDKDAFASDPGALWQIPPDVSVWESAPTDLNPIRMFIKDDVEALAAVTFTPLHYITPDAANGSAEGAATMREGHVFRTEDRRRRVEAGLATTFSLAFAAMGDATRAKGVIKTIWAPAERYSLEQRANAALAASAAGLPQASIYTDIFGYAPGDLPRLEDERAQDLLFLQMSQPAPDPVTGKAGKPLQNPAQSHWNAAHASTASRGG